MPGPTRGETGIETLTEKGRLRVLALTPGLLQAVPVLRAALFQLAHAQNGKTGKGRLDSRKLDAHNVKRRPSSGIEVSSAVGVGDRSLSRRARRWAGSCGPV